MKDSEIIIKLSYITGLRPVVLAELSTIPELRILYQEDDSVFVEFTNEALTKVGELKSVSRAYIVTKNRKYHPQYISNHKSILGTLIDIVLEHNKESFENFKITCAGADSPEVRSIARYIEESYRLIEAEEADLKIHIIKSGDTWELGVQATPRPLSLRDYKVAHMSGAMDPTIAYAVNHFCELGEAESYLNIFSGSGTLLIEALQCYPNLNKLVGIDNDKKHLSLSIQNIKKAGLIKKIEVREASIFDKPDLGKFDAITSDLPFGMSISKGENLSELYEAFVEYCEDALMPNGRLVAYTNEYEILESVIKNSKFEIVKTLDLKFMTSVDAYLKPRILVCEFR